MAIIARHLTISGRVQGVWFRAWTAATATDLHLAGWVRNRRNGDVEAVVQGAEDAVTRFLALAWTGPSAARVTNVRANAIDVEPMIGFEQLPDK